MDLANYLYNMNTISEDLFKHLNKSFIYLDVEN